VTDEICVTIYPGLECEVHLECNCNVYRCITVL